MFSFEIVFFIVFNRDVNDVFTCFNYIINYVVYMFIEVVLNIVLIIKYLERVYCSIVYISLEY